jgi:hypothetical protein
VAPTIAGMTAEIRENNIAKGWRSAVGGPGENTLGDYIALLHTEAAEATEAYRTWRLEDPTGPDHPFRNDGSGCCTRCEEPHHVGPYKPEGVGSELADILIRLLDTGDVFGFTVFEPDFQLGDVAEVYPHITDPELPGLESFADHMAWLARRIDRIWTDTRTAPALALRTLVTIARKYGFDLDFEYERKMTYNRTRSYRHGGRALSDTNA